MLGFFVLDKNVCKACVNDFASSWSDTRETLWRIGELLCPCLHKRISVLDEPPESCRCYKQHSLTPVSDEETLRWTCHVDDIRDAAWAAIKDRRVFFVRHSFSDPAVGEQITIRCRETGDPISESNCFVGHKVHFFDMIDDFLLSFQWDIYKDVRVVKKGADKSFEDARVESLWLSFYKRKSEFSTQLLSRHGAHIRDQRWISNVQRESRDGIGRVVFTRDGMPYRYLVGAELKPDFDIVVTNKKHGGKGEYIGRPSPLGNPFPISSENDRASVILKYREWLLGKIRGGDCEVVSEMKRLRDIAVTKGKLELQCWCTPKQCHGEVIKEFIEILPSLLPSCV